MVLYIWMVWGWSILQSSLAGWSAGKYSLRCRLFSTPLVVSIAMQLLMWSYPSRLLLLFGLRGQMQRKLGPEQCSEVPFLIVSKVQVLYLILIYFELVLYIVYVFWVWICTCIPGVFCSVSLTPLFLVVGLNLGWSAYYQTTFKLPGFCTRTIQVSLLPFAVCFEVLYCNA